MEPVSTEECIGRTNRTALKRGWFDKMVVVDARGRRFPVREVEELGPDGPFWGLSLMHGRKVRVRLLYGQSNQLELDELKAMVMRALRHDQTFYEATEVTIEELEAGILSAADFAEVLRWIG